MSLSDILENPPSKTTACGFASWVATLDQKDQDAAWFLLRDRRWTTVDLARIFAEQGCPVRKTQITVHRLGRCTVCVPR